MSLSDSTGDWASRQGQAFPSTRWSVVLAAGDDSSTVADEALEKLCRVYWYPLYGFVRRQGRGPEEAQDMTQEFFARLLKNKSVKQADQDRGRFRTFLLASLKHFLVSEWRKGQAAKRHGGPMLSLDDPSAEQRYQAESGDSLSPERLFEKRWATALLDQVLRRLGDEYAALGQRALFDQLKTSLWGDKAARPYPELAAALGMTEGALRVAVHRMRQRHLEVLRAEVADTLADPAEVDNELRHLIQVMAE